MSKLPLEEVLSTASASAAASAVPQTANRREKASADASSMPDPGGAAGKTQERKKKKREPGALDQFHILDDYGRVKGPFDFRIREDIEKRNQLFVLGDVLYIYHHGVFRPDERKEVKKAIENRLYKEFIRSTTIDRIFRLFLLDANLTVMPDELNQFPDSWINFRNGFYDAATGEFHPHKDELARKYFAVNQLPHDFDPDARPDGSLIEDWLQFAFPDDDDREMLLEFLGYCMTKSTSQQRFLILTGDGGNGKSIVLNLLGKMIGAENIAHVSLGSLQERFVSYNLVGKLVNSCGDIETKPLEDPQIFKQITGEDVVSVERKGAQHFDYKSYAKCIFSANGLPLVKDERTRAFFRRMLVIHVDRKPPKEDPYFSEKLEKQIDYLIHAAVDALGRMYARPDGRLFESENSQKAVAQYRRDSDSTTAFLEECTEPDPASTVSKDDLYERYTIFCKNEGMTPLFKRSFCKALTDKGYKDGRKTNCRYFIGLRLVKNCYGADHDATFTVPSCSVMESSCSVIESAKKEHTDEFLDANMLPEAVQMEIPF